MSKLIMMVRHAVEDYRKWRPVFDGDMGKQKAAGLTDPCVYRSADDGNAVLILWDAEDKQRASDFATAASLKLAMTHVGVVGTPDVTFQEAA